MMIEIGFILVYLVVMWATDAYDWHKQEKRRDAYDLQHADDYAVLYENNR